MNELILSRYRKIGDFRNYRLLGNDRSFNVPEYFFNIKTRQQLYFKETTSYFNYYRVSLFLRKTGIFFNNQQEGFWMTLFDNNTKAGEEHFRNGVLDGFFVSFWANGFKQEEGFYEKGKKVGHWNYWHVNGVKAIRFS